MAIAWKHSNLCILGMAYKWVHSGYEDCSQKNFSTIVEASPIPSTISFSREKFTIFFWFWKKTDPPKLYIFSWYNSSYKPQIQSCHQYHQNWHDSNSVSLSSHRWNQGLVLSLASRWHPYHLYPVYTRACRSLFLPGLPTSYCCIKCVAYLLWYLGYTACP